jgi:hypothetical protein
MRPRPAIFTAVCAWHKSRYPKVAKKTACDAPQTGSTNNLRVLAPTGNPPTTAAPTPGACHLQHESPTLYLDETAPVLSAPYPSRSQATVFAPSEAVPP